jgi:hypothetical protein
MQALFAVGLLLVSLNVHAHGGGLDSSGCHTKRSTEEYHCHRGNHQPSDTTSRQMRSRQMAPPQSDQTCHIGPRGGRYRIVNGRKRYGC